MTDKTLWPVYEIRPLPNELETCWRYAKGHWVEDDGRWDLAFAGKSKERYAIVLGVELPSQKNLLWGWLTGSWQKKLPRSFDHPDGNPWHYSLRVDTHDWGKYWGKEAHPNERAYKEGMNWTCTKYGAANGRPIRFALKNPYILAGLVRDRETGTVLVPPAEPLCMYCGHKWLERVSVR